jgi:hypothetical protein
MSKSRAGEAHAGGIANRFPSRGEAESAYTRASRLFVGLVAFGLDALVALIGTLAFLLGRWLWQSLGA